MTNNSQLTSTIDLSVVNETLILDGEELLQKVTYELHRHLGSFCTVIFDIDKFHSKARPLACSSQDNANKVSAFFVRGTASEHVINSGQTVSIYRSGLKEIFKKDDYVQSHQLEGYVGVPLKTKSGEIIGILVSTFDSAIKDEQNVIFHHLLFANVVVHSLRSKWLSARSDSLVNQLSYEVSHDNLTGLMNRSFLSDKLEYYAANSKENFTLAYLDIDNFKSINDLYGNYIGDQIIRFVANTILQSVPEDQLSFRIAGDEFAFITFSSDPLAICSNIIDKLDAGFIDSSHNIKVSISIGVARKVDTHQTADQLILNATLALKACKQNRTNKIQCYDTHLSAQYYRRTMVIDALRNELNKPLSADSEIYVLVQPIVDKNDPKWRHYEILARWHSKTLGVIYPMEFIEAAEQSGLIVDLGERIIELACEAKKQLEEGLGYTVRLSLNCSAHELNDSARYLDHLLHTINKFQYAPSDFTIELTETVLLTQTSEARKILDRLRSLGFTVALDDFGTGYSSLNYIHSYPIDCIKIDATFVRNMLCNETSERVVWLIIQLAEQLKVSLVAEGVETKEALEKLHDMGCKKIQGYYFSKPETPSSLIHHLTDSGITPKASNQ
ncbi:sensor domain-containing phosphodiesterase [Vibrio olivae]|uniref:EAL domain-containing protein n=1 Tax=Vibrio olivae TaxID=1243002 RepID=A0ABV5HND5_9VIBR